MKAIISFGENFSQEMSHGFSSRGYRDNGESLASLSRESENYAWIPQFSRHLVNSFFKTR